MVGVSVQFETIFTDLFKSRKNDNMEQLNVVAVNSSKIAILIFFAHIVQVWLELKRRILYLRAIWVISELTLAVLKLCCFLFILLLNYSRDGPRFSFRSKKSLKFEKLGHFNS